MPLFKLPLIFCAAVASICWATPWAQAEVRQWQVGADGLSWREQEQSSTAIRFDPTGSIQLVDFNTDDNIVEQLRWGEGFPLDFISELAGARIWDNVPFKQSNAPLVDGDPSTSSQNRFKEFGVLQAGRTFFLDLGTRFPINRILFFPRQSGADSKGRPYSEDFIRGYKILTNDGVRFSSNNLPIYSLLTQVDFTTESIAETRLPLQFVRYIKLDITSSNPFEISEFQIYGTGHPPGGKYQSKVIDLGETANFSRLNWATEKLRQVDGELTPEPDADSHISVRMRTGRDDTPQVYYEIVNVFTGDIVEVSQSDYKRLDASVRGPSEEDQTNWSEWSSPFTESGQQIELPSPRRYFQFEIAMESQAILDGIRVNSLSVEHSIPPLAQQLIGEISVLDEPHPPGNKPRVTAGTQTTFAYDVKADIIATDVGFDAIRISTPSRARLVEFLVGSPLVPAIPDSIDEGPNSLTLFFPSQRVDAQSLGSLRIVFEAQVFVQATFFNAEVFDTQSTESPQRILPGDAHPNVLSNNLRILTTVDSAQNLFPFFTVAPKVMTPNGDDLNDHAEISYTLVQFTQPVETQVEVYSLGGRRVRTLFSGEQSSGVHTLSWDGRDDQGTLLPVGIYLVKTSVLAKSQDFVRLGTIGIVY